MPAKKYLIPLRLAQVLEDKLHLTAGEVPVIDAIARGEQRGREAVGVVDVAVEAAQRIGGGADGEVHRGQLALGVGTDFYFHISFFIIARKSREPLGRRPKGLKSITRSFLSSRIFVSHRSHETEFAARRGQRQSHEGKSLRPCLSATPSACIPEVHASGAMRAFVRFVRSA